MNKNKTSPWPLADRNDKKKKQDFIGTAGKNGLFKSYLASRVAG
jgi:hypothetical protein